MNQIIRNLIILLFLTGITFAQYHYDPDFEHNYRNTFTPVEMALGGMTSLMEPSGYGHVINPAILSEAKTQFLFSYRYNKMRYWDLSRYRSFNLNYNIGKYGAFGLSYIEYKPTTVILMTTIENPDGEGLFKQTRDYYTLSYAIKVFSDFTVGLSLNHESNNMLYGITPEYQGLDLAFLFNKEVDWFENVNTRIIFSAVLDNFYRMGDYDYIYMIDNLVYIPPIEFLQKYGLLTFSGQLASKKKYLGKRIIAANIQAGYTDLLDESIYSLFTLGVELNILEYLTLRYANSQGDEDGRRSSMSYLGPKNTFGFGLELPLGELIGVAVPLNIKLDYAHSFSKYAWDYVGGEYIYATSDLNAFSLGISLNEL